MGTHRKPGFLGWEGMHENIWNKCKILGKIHIPHENLGMKGEI